MERMTTSFISTILYTTTRMMIQQAISSSSSSSSSQQRNHGSISTNTPPSQQEEQHGNKQMKSTSPSLQTFKIFVVLIAFGIWTFLSAHLNGLIHSDSSSRSAAALLESSLPRIMEQPRSLRTGGGVGGSHSDDDHVTMIDQSVSSTMNNHIKKSSFSKNPYETFQESWYIADEPDMEAFDYIYEDEHIMSLKHNSSYQPYQIQMIKGGKKPVLAGAGIHPIYTGLRSLDEAVSYFNPICFHYRFPDLSVFPTISVILPVQNERSGLLTLTVHSILAHTPPSILQQIIIVDDNGELPEERIQVDEEELRYIRELHPHKIVYIKNVKKQGCAGARLQGIRAATAEVLVVVDSHVEMYSSTWAQHLLLPILENSRTMSMQTLDSLDDRPGYHRMGAGISQHWGIIDDNFVFNYVESRFDDISGTKTLEQPSVRVPFETPFTPGSLFAIRRNEFWRLGGYDEGLGVWGAENTELAMKVWRCGFNDHHDQETASRTTEDDGQEQSFPSSPPQPPGRIVVVPCSRVGHVYRVHTEETGRWPPPLPDYVMEQYGLLDKGKWLFRGRECDNFTKVVIRNNMRIMRVWMGQNSSATKRYYDQAWGVKSTDPKNLAPEWRKYELEMDTDESIAKQLTLQKENKCKDFEWFDKHVYHKLTGRHHPWHPSEWATTSCGQHNAKNCGECPQGYGETWCNGDCHWCKHGGEDQETIWQQHHHPKTGAAFATLSEKSQCISRKLDCRDRPPLQVDIE